MKLNKEVAKALCDANVIRFGEFTLTSGKISPVYIDLRVIPSFPESMQKITDELVKLVKKLKIDKLAGAETAGIPIAAAISIKSSIPMVYIRRRPKRYGTYSLVEGILNKDEKAVLIDDLITDGKSKAMFLEGIIKAGAKVEDVVVILDREQGGAETLKAEGIKLHSLITLRELVGYMKKNQLINDEQYRKVIDYLEGK